jgi:hypothetical protein
MRLTHINRHRALEFLSKNRGELHTKIVEEHLGNIFSVLPSQDFQCVNRGMESIIQKI